MKRRGLFISFEGGEGAGKSTVMGASANLLAQAGVAHRMTREPGGCPLGEALRALVLDPRHAGTCREAEVLMMFAARAQHVVETIEPALAGGQWVVSDRFTDASFAYQGGGRGVAWAQLQALEQWTVAGRAPDLTLWFDLDPAEAARRRAAARSADRFEAEDLDFFARVRAAYARRVDEQPQRFERIDAGQSLDGVAAQLSAALQRRGW